MILGIEGDRHNIYLLLALQQQCLLWQIWASGLAGSMHQVGAGGCGEKARRGTLPRASTNQTGQALKGEAKARLIGGAGWQVDLDLGLQLDDAGADLDPRSNWSTARAGRAGGTFCRG